MSLSDKERLFERIKLLKEAKEKGEILEKPINNTVKEKCCKNSTSFKECLTSTKISALFNNEKKLGALITKSKLSIIFLKLIV